MRNKYLLLLTIGVTAWWGLLTFTTSLIAGERIIVDGVVATTRDTGGNITAVKLNLKIEGENIFNIVLDEHGKKLGAEMDGKWVEIIGDVSTKGDEQWLEVKSYNKIEEKFLQ